MQSLEIHPQRRVPTLRDRMAQRLVYVPGAVVLMYGFWLSLGA